MLDVDSSGTKFDSLLTKADFDWANSHWELMAPKVAISGAQVLDVSVDGTSGNLAIALSAPIAGLDGSNDTIAISSGFVTKVGAAQVQVIENATVTSGYTSTIRYCDYWRRV